jgi:hypothetical protein
MELINSSNRGMHSRYVHVYRGIAECDYCKETKEILSVDTSDDEYRRFDCCFVFQGYSRRKRPETTDRLFAKAKGPLLMYVNCVTSRRCLLNLTRMNLR